MNDNDSAPNQALRAHVTDHSFVLTLRKTHIAVLIHLAADPREGHPLDPGKALRVFWVPSVSGLVTRGLVEHRHSPNFRGVSGKAADRITDYYRITRAGWAVYELLVEAGIAPALTVKRKLVA